MMQTGGQVFAKNPVTVHETSLTAKKFSRFFESNINFENYGDASWRTIAKIIFVTTLFY
jgi:hypothetical protein